MSCSTAGGRVPTLGGISVSSPTPLLLRVLHDVCFLKGIKLGCYTPGSLFLYEGKKYIIKIQYFPPIPSKVKIVTVEKKVNEVLNRLEKTKMERFPDLAAEKEGRDREERNEKKAQIQEMKRREKEEMKKKREMDELRYAGAAA